VLEQRGNDVSKKVRRFILWSRAQNFTATKQGYVPDMKDLRHVSAFLQDLEDEAATIRDLALSFWQIEIPSYARDLYRFQDIDGAWYEMQRVPMGHVCSPELMQIVASVISGHPRYCKPEYALAVNSRRVWIDNIRLTGTVREMRVAGAWLDESAKAVGAVWKLEDSQDAVTSYDFLAGHWDHENKTIRLSDKSLAKLPTTINDTMSFRDAEVLVGRLVHAAGMLRLPLFRYYAAMKWFRRRANSVNCGRSYLDEQLIVPPSARCALQEWLTRARVTTYVPVVRSEQKWPAVLISDASLVGWGAILITPGQQVHVVGGRWQHQYESHQINYLEAAAVRNALVMLFDTLSEGSFAELQIVVDNTSVQGALARGSSPSQTMADILLEVATMLEVLSIPVSVEYIASKMNPADPISRGQRPDWSAALWTDERWGRRRAGARCTAYLPFAPAANP
jgi:hypothetical protein